ncbi:hypothetical protein [Aquimarina hainanensis]
MKFSKRINSSRKRVYYVFIGFFIIALLSMLVVSWQLGIFE